MPKLRKSTIDKAAPSDRPYEISCSEQRGLLVRVYPNGRKVFYFRARLPGGRQAKTKIGEYGRGWTLDQAVGELDRLRRARDRGESPTEVKRAAHRAAEAARRAPSVGEMVAAYMRDHVAHHCTKTTAKGFRALQRRYIDNGFDGSTPFGDLKSATASRADVERLFLSVGKSSPGAANHVLTFLSAAFRWGEVHEYREHGTNPCASDRRGVAGIKRYRGRKMQRILTHEERADLAVALAEAERRGPRVRGGADVDVVELIRVLAFTGSRLSEIQALEWPMVSWVNATGRLWTSKEGGEKVLLFPRPAMEVLERHADRAVAAGRAKTREKLTGQVFAAYNPGRAWRNTIRPLAGLDGADGRPPLRLHDLRHAWISSAMAAGVQLHLAGRAQGHSRPETTEGYAHYADASLRAAVERTGEALAVISDDEAGQARARMAARERPARQKRER